jgi:hypothetical protein
VVKSSSKGRSISGQAGCFKLVINLNHSVDQFNIRTDLKVLIGLFSTNIEIKT